MFVVEQYPARLRGNNRLANNEKTHFKVLRETEATSKAMRMNRTLRLKRIGMTWDLAKRRRRHETLRPMRIRL